jgi:hypothetical protein
MTKNEAHAHLNRLREGHPMPVSLTTQALLLTGDILPRLPNSTLRSNGNEPCHDRTIQMESKGTEGRFSYSAYLDSQQNKGDAT